MPTILPSGCIGALAGVDGVQVDTRSIAGLGSFDNGQNITLGNDPTGGYLSATVTYQIDDVGIWRLGLTPGRIGQSFDVVGLGSLTYSE